MKLSLEPTPKNQKGKSQKDKSQEFSRTLERTLLDPGHRYTIDLKASDEECAALARRFGILGLEDVEAYLEVDHLYKEDVIRISGTLCATVEQVCGVSLLPFTRDVETTFAFSCADSPPEENPSEDHEDMSEPMETFVDGTLDLGEVLAQYLSLEISPFARNPESVLSSSREDVMINAPLLELQKPFENLASLLKYPAE